MSKVYGQFAIIAFVFAIVLGGSYPIVDEARRQSKIDRDPDRLKMEDDSVARKYAAAQQHPEKIDDLIAAGNQMAIVALRKHDFNQAIEIYNNQLSATWSLATNAYNPRWIGANLRLAGVFRDQANWTTSKMLYETVLEQDRKYFPANDPKIGRDLNNLGLIEYLKGLSLEKPAERAAQFQLAVDDYKKSLAISDQHPEAKTARAATLWNLYLAERDLDHRAEAQEYRRQARAIDQSMNRVCREP